MAASVQGIPENLQKYIVQQNYEQYTKENHSTWRLIMKRLKSFLSDRAYNSYRQGLEKTGITMDGIPRISDIDQKLQSLGWRAVPVSGFIPPVAFMEFQLNSILPIAVSIRQAKHIDYTPAPDIVHEAAGHTPFLIEPVFNSFLKKYAAALRKSIIHKQEFEQYAAIRKLSDVKENPASSLEEIQQAKLELNRVNKALPPPSEAALLSRFIWWTSEYGLIGDIKNYKIYGAGLLSSLGEAKHCFTSQVKKIPLDRSCTEYSYDITNYQPQLFVTPDFETLHEVLSALEKQLAFYKGGEYGLKLARHSGAVCTIQLNTGVQVSGVLSDYFMEKGRLAYIKLTGPCQLSYKDQELPGHSKQTHSEGYSTPLGPLKDSHKSLQCMSETEVRSLFEDKNTGMTTLDFALGWNLKGRLVNSIEKEGQLIVLRFENCQVLRGEKQYFKPEWGEGVFDLAVGEEAVSVFGGPADRKAFKDLDFFVNNKEAKAQQSTHIRTK